MKDLIFEKPALAPFSNRLGWAFFTALCWAVWVYLWMPLVTFTAWALGFYAYGTYIDGYAEPNLRDFTHLALVYIGVVCVMGGSLLLWARLEFVRFHNVNRRTSPPAVTEAEIAVYAQLTTHQIVVWTNARRVIAHHDAQGCLIGDADVRIAA